MKYKLLEKASTYFDEALTLKDIARVSNNNIEYFLEAAEKYGFAQTYYSKLLKQNGLSKNDKYYILSMYYYCEYEINECKYGWNYKNGLFDLALECGKKAISAIQEAINYINYNFTSKTNIEEIYQQRKNFEFTKLCSFFMRYEPLSKKAMQSQDYITAFDYYNVMLKNQKKCIEFVEKNYIDETHIRITKGNYHAMAVNISNALCFHLISNYDNKNYEIKYTLIKTLINACLESEEAFDKNPEWIEYLEGQKTLKHNLDTILESFKSYWKNLMIDLDDSKLLEKRMKHVDIKKYNEIKIELELEKNFIKKLYLVGGFWISILISVIASVAIIINFNLPFYNLFLIMLLVQSLYLITAAFILKTIDSISEEGFFKLLKLAMKISFKGLDKLKNSSSEKHSSSHNPKN